MKTQTNKNKIDRTRRRSQQAGRQLLGLVGLLFCFGPWQIPLEHYGVDAISEVKDFGVPCTTDEDCEQHYDWLRNSTEDKSDDNTTVSQGNYSISQCLNETKTCSNPYLKGCLRTRLGESYRPRVCNSDDLRAGLVQEIDGTEKDGCLPPPIDYPEIRIHNGNWDSSIINAWINQIVLSELVYVPATVGLTSEDTPLSSFYGKENLLSYSDFVYPWKALETGNTLGLDQKQCNETEEMRTPCVQCLPEVWDDQKDDYNLFLNEGIIDPPTANGQLGNSGLYIPIWLAEEYPELSIWFGLRGEEKRKFLAELFPRPTSWKDYCERYSSDGCATPDATAARPPASELEASSYFEAGLYTGDFRFTDQNNCTKFPTTCTGSVIAPPCRVSFDLEAQLYWNGIVGLESSGPNDPNGWYSPANIRQIWFAANATRSPIIMYGIEPSPVPTLFFGTDYEYQLVTFPSASRECEAYRNDYRERCSDDIDVRRGDKRGACGASFAIKQKIISRSLGDMNTELEDSEQSPAIGMLQNLKIRNLDINEILKLWQKRNDPREAVCEWVTKNVEELEVFIPSGFPRNVRYRSTYDVWYLYLTQAISGLIGIIGLIAFALCYKYRETKVMVFAQPLFMMLILQGFNMICAGAVLYAFEPSKLTCTMSAWLVVLGYTIELVPVLVKTSAINQLIRSSTKKKTVNISRRVMLMKVAFVVLLVSAFLVCWTYYDPPMSVEFNVLEEDEFGDVTVLRDVKCASRSSPWRVVSFGWQGMLLVLAAVLAIQSRDMMAQLNESKSLGNMVYSHSVFVVMRAVFAFFYVYDILPSSATACLFSLNYSFDALFAMGIYVLPKIWVATQTKAEYKPGHFRSELSRFTATEKATLDEDAVDCARYSNPASILDTGELKILNCTANLGNQEPTFESLEAWIPPGGNCSRIEYLDNDNIMTGTFDLVAIGMQEATWTDTGKSTRVGIKGDKITEEELLNALEEANTAQLREMIQETLGDEYFQVVDEQRGEMRLHLWVKRTIIKDIVDIKISGSNTGIGNMLANKGGIIAAVYYKNIRISFLSAHLAAHEGDAYYKARCDNIRTILREAKTFDPTKKFDDAMTSHHIFLIGDLNFRIKFGSENKHEDDVKRAMDLIEKKDYSSLYVYDELAEGISEGDLLVDFQTLPCTFPPTFKLERRQGCVYKAQRTPSYTDRILFKSANGHGKNLKALSYEACPDFITSDHKPVRGAFLLKSNDRLESFQSNGDVTITFRKMRCSDLPAGDADGFSDPYIMFLWDSIDLQSEDVDLMDQIRELWLGKSWPRTKYISKTLNPYWKGIRKTLTAPNTRIGPEAMLFVAVIDFDAVGKDGLLGAVALNVRNLLSMQKGESQKTLTIDEQLTKGARPAGRLKCKVDIKVNCDKVEANLLSRMGSLIMKRGSVPDTNKVKQRSDI